MKKSIVTVIGATVLLAAASTVAVAGSRGASSFSPGQQMQGQTAPTTQGASQFTPADQMKDNPGTTTKGASEFTPGDKRNDARKKK
jgi:hypothetical protein